ncbi:MAG: hypothetical protein ACI83I_001106 [Bacteroidia bacterium]|jgi:hypothetical protein
MIRCKTILISFVLLFFITSSIQAQIGIKALGLKAGVNYGESVIKETFKDGGTDFTYATHEADVALSWGLFTRLKVLNYFFQPEIMASSQNTRMKLSSADFDSFLTLKQNRFDIPLMIGFSKMDKIRAFTGPVYTRLLENRVMTDEFLFKESKELFKNGTWAWQLGFGFDLGRLAIDMRYETSLGRLKYEVQLRNQTFKFDQRNNSVQVYVGYDLIK